MCGTIKIMTKNSEYMSLAACRVELSVDRRYDHVLLSRQNMAHAASKHVALFFPESTPRVGLTALYMTVNLFVVIHFIK